MIARIYKPTKTAMQSGTRKTKRWVLDFEPAAPRNRDPLMGWTSATDMTQQVRLFFATKDEAIAYAERNGLEFRVLEPKAREPKRKFYADNFRYDRTAPWTH